MPQVHALIIDDNANNLSVLVKLLGIEGVTCITLPNAVNLLNHLEKLDGLDIVFLDLEMPRVNGYEALTILKAYPRFSHIPVVAYTVHISEMNAAFEMGFDAFIGKPINAEEFPEQLKQILRGEKICYLP